MLARKIKSNHRSMTGAIPSNKEHYMRYFESSLERDFYLILEFDLNVRSYQEQPLRIEYVDSKGKIRSYIPDVLVKFRDDIEPAIDMQPWLCEIKYKDDLERNHHKYKEKFEAARTYSEKQGWEFRIVDERDIRTTHLENVKFFMGYRNIQMNNDGTMLLDMLHQLRETDPASILAAMTDNKWRRAEIMTQLWHLISVRMIGADLNIPFNMKSRIWVMEY